jgi:hypothetical protein
MRLVDWLCRVAHEVLCALMREAMLSALDHRAVIDRVAEIAREAVGKDDAQ